MSTDFSIDVVGSMWKISCDGDIAYLEPDKYTLISITKEDGLGVDTRKVVISIQTEYRYYDSFILCDSDSQALDIKCMVQGEIDKALEKDDSSV